MFCLYKGVIGDARANVCVETKSFSHCNVEALVTATLRRSDRRFQKYPRAAQGVPGTGLDAGRVPARETFSPMAMVSISRDATASFKMFRVAAMISGPVASPCA